jgi:putative heme-binding domain-containing protein
MGPDGALYVADWYNPIIQHGEVEFRDERRDHTHGRIWRITARGRPLVKLPRLAGASVEALLEALKEPEDWTRGQARRELQERGAKEVRPTLEKWLRKLGAIGSDADHLWLEALWVAQSVRVRDDRLLALSASHDHRVRAAVSRVAGDWASELDGAKLRLDAAVADPHPQVRLEAVNAIRSRKDAASARLALRVLDLPMDEFLDYALWLTVRETASHWLPRVKADIAFFGERPQPLLYALKAVNDSSAADVAEKLFRSGKVAAADVVPVLEMLASQGTAEQMRLVFEEVLAGRQATAGLAALEQAARQDRSRKPSGDLTIIRKTLYANDPAVAASAARLAGLWRVDSREVRRTLAFKARTGGSRAAIEGLGLLGDAESRTALVELCGAKYPVDTRREAVVALASLDAREAAQQAVTLLAEAPRGIDPTALLAAFISRTGGPETLAKALAGKRLPGEIAAAGIRQLSSAGRKLPELEAALRTAGGLDPVAKALTPAELKQFIADVQTKGDPHRGERVYRQEQLGCVKCHAIGGAGGIVGPDMVSLGASAQVDYLIESLLEPSKKIKENYHTVTVQTGDGRTVAGVVVQKTETHLVLRDQNDELVKIAVADIDRQANSPLSLMPEGTVKSLRRDELVDLVRFLSELGKTGGLVVPRTPMVRRWQVLPRTDAVNDHVRHNGVASPAGDHPALQWTPAYSLVSGELPLEGLPWQGGIDNRSYQYLRFEIKVTAAGRIGLRFNDPSGLRLWTRPSESKTVEGKPADSAAVEIALNTKSGELTTLNLGAGLHTFTIASASQERKMKPLRIELTELADSSGRAEAVLGK